MEKKVYAPQEKEALVEAFLGVVSDSRYLVLHDMLLCLHASSCEPIVWQHGGHGHPLA